MIADDGEVESGAHDPEVVVVVDVWRKLPLALRAGILVMVRAIE